MMSNAPASALRRLVVFAPLASLALTACQTGVVPHGPTVRAREAGHGDLADLPEAGSDTIDIPKYLSSVFWSSGALPKSLRQSETALPTAPVRLLVHPGREKLGVITASQADRRTLAQVDRLSRQAAAVAVYIRARSVPESWVQDCAKAGATLIIKLGRDRIGGLRRAGSALVAEGLSSGAQKAALHVWFDAVTGLPVGGRILCFRGTAPDKSRSALQAIRRASRDVLIDQEGRFAFRDLEENRADAVSVLISEAKRHLGRRYLSRFAGYSFDCSGFMSWCFAQIGIKLPRSSREQALVGQSVERSRIRPGDLLFFAIDGRHISHVGMAISSGASALCIHAGNKGIKIDGLDWAYWTNRFVCARRVI